MAIKIKLSENNIADYKTTPTGYVISKEDFTVVEKVDRHVQYIIDSQDCVFENLAVEEPNKEKNHNDMSKKELLESFSDLEIDSKMTKKQIIEVIEESSDNSDEDKKINEGEVEESLVDNDLDKTFKE